MTTPKKEICLQMLATAATVGQGQTRSKEAPPTAVDCMVGSEFGGGKNTTYNSMGELQREDAKKRPIGDLITEDDNYSKSSESDSDEDENDGNMRISKNEKRWFKTYFRLKRYKEAHGHCMVPREYPINPKLGTWVAVQRKQYHLLMQQRPSSMTSDRITLLNELDFEWSPQEVIWNGHFNDYIRFKEEFGHTNITAVTSTYPKLYLWVREQRRHYSLMKKGQKSHMTLARAKKLDSVQFCWDTCEALWNERFQELVDFQREHGHCVMPSNEKKHQKLAAWISNQRRVYKSVKSGKSGYMPAHRIQALESVGFNWAPRDA